MKCALSYLSVYRLFFGGSKCLGIESIRLMKENRNYRHIIKALLALDAMVSGQTMDQELFRGITNKDVELLKHLYDHYSLKSDNKKYDDYIYRTYNCFIRHKQHIDINLFNLHHNRFRQGAIKVNEDLKNWIMNTTENGGPRRYDGDLTNLFKWQLFEIFNHATSIKFDLKCNDAFSISLESLLWTIQGSSVEKIHLILGIDDDDDYDGDFYYNTYWSKAYPFDSPLYTVKETYANAGYEIGGLIRHTGSNGQELHCIITKNLDLKQDRTEEIEADHDDEDDLAEEKSVSESVKGLDESDDE